MENRDSAVDMASHGSGNIICHLHPVQTDSGAHPTSYSKGIVGRFSGHKAAVALSWAYTSSTCRSQEYVNLYIQSPLSLHGVMLI
jgi:hypothetical protein